jgi:two-component sensor histidine kinase
LILTELVTNAHKHAFPPNFTSERQPQINVSFEETAAEYRLSVWDNGIGLPDGFDLHHTHSLGLQLVGMLAQQLQGEVVVTGEQGAHFRVTFPKVIGS